MNIKSLMSGTFAWPILAFERFGDDRAAPMAASTAFKKAVSRK